MATTRVFACLGSLGDVPSSQLLDWLHFHRAVGISHFFVPRDDEEADGRLLRLLEVTPNVTILPRSHWPWTRESPLVNDIRAKYIGQISFLHRCVAAATALAGNSDGGAWLANLDVDEYLMPQRAALATRNRFQRLPRVIASAANASAKACLSLRRHSIRRHELVEMSASHAWSHRVHVSPHLAGRLFSSRE